MAVVAALNWAAVIMRFLPEIQKIGKELYSLYCSIRGAKHDKETVLMAMKLLNRYQDDINRLLQNEEEKRELMNGLTILMKRINESNSNNNIESPRANGWNTTSCGGDCGASVPSKSSFKRVLGWMECDVCRDDYNTTTRRPLILHCGHTVCRQCVEKLAQRGLIKCPTCRSCETRRFASIPTNTVLMPVLEDLGSQAKDKDSSSSNEKGSMCNGTTLSYEQQIQFAIFLSKQEAKTQGQALVKQRWQEVEESPKYTERCQAKSVSAPFHLPQDEDEDASVELANKLQQEEVAKMKRLCGNTSNDWNKELHCFFGPSLQAFVNLPQ